MAYGGDFGDEPNDYNFVMDGLMWSDHKRGPNLIEYAKAIEPIQTLDFKDNAVTVINRYDFIGIEHLECVWEIRSEGANVLAQGDAQMPDSKNGLYFCFLAAAFY